MKQSKREHIWKIIESGLESPEKDRGGHLIPKNNKNPKKAV